jgi:hypothetical protein
MRLPPSRVLFISFVPRFSFLVGVVFCFLLHSTSDAQITSAENLGIILGGSKDKIENDLN